MSGVAGVRFEALGTSAHVLVSEPDKLSQADAMTRAELDALDLAASRFRDSELVALNEAAGIETVVSRLLFTAIEEALYAARTTGGLIDPTVGHALELCGYDRDFSAVESNGAPIKALFRPVPGWRAVQLDRTAVTVRLPKGVKLDLGATAKAGCADRTATLLARTLRCGVLVNLGGDLSIAGPAPSGGWAVRIADRHDAPNDADGVTIALERGGLATSSTTARRWLRGGTTFHHIIDPSTGQPAAAHWRTVSVVADSCLLANIASTASVILGQDAPEWVARRGLAARLVHELGWCEAVGPWPQGALVSHGKVA